MRKIKSNVLKITVIEFEPKDLINRQFWWGDPNDNDKMKTLLNKIEKVFKYKEMMKNGEWELVPNNLSINEYHDVPILFLENGLQWGNGKHRMLALSQLLGELITVRFICIVGWPIDKAGKKYLNTDESVLFRGKALEKLMANNYNDVKLDFTLTGDTTFTLKKGYIK